jgi:hypothetical protein
MAQRIFSIFFLWATLFSTLLTAQTPYYGPNHPAKPSDIPVQLYVYDETDTGITKVESVTFDGINVALQPAYLYVFSGGGGYQMGPGSYNLEWTVSSGQRSWPRTQTFKQTVTIQPGDSWLQVTIKGDKATVF